MATLAARAELKAQQVKIEKLRTYDSSPFIGQSYFGNDGSQNSLIFQSIYKTFKMSASLTDAIVE